MKNLLKSVVYLFLTIIGMSGMYLIVAIILSVIPVNSDTKCDEHCIDIFIISNGVHSDLVLPISNNIMDWRRIVKFEHTTSMDTSYKYVAFGWGDKHFYLNTPTWSDFKLTNALYALFLFGESAIHTTFFQDMAESEFSVRIRISEYNYSRIVEFVLEEFEQDAEGNPILIQNFNYSSYDAFYKAKGTFTLFYSCNTWVNQALKHANQKTCLWTPFVDGIFYQYSTEIN